MIENQLMFLRTIRDMIIALRMKVYFKFSFDRNLRSVAQKLFLRITL